MNRRTEILETALRLFLTHGYENASMRMLAEELGVTKPAIYHYFPGKEALALEVVDLFQQRTGAWVTEHMRAAVDFRSWMRALFASIPVFSHVERIVLNEEPGEGYRHGFNEFVSSVAGGSPALRERMTAIMTQARERMIERLRASARNGEIPADIDPEALGFLIHAAIEGMATISHFDPAIDEAAISTRMCEQLVTLLSGEGRSE